MGVIRIFTKDEVNGIESRLPFKIFSSLIWCLRTKKFTDEIKSQPYLKKGEKIKSVTRRYIDNID